MSKKVYEMGEMFGYIGVGSQQKKTVGIIEQ
jgi:hypothetical protein